MTTRDVALHLDSALRYPERAPFDPVHAFPEYPFGARCVDSGNRVYGAVRELLHDLGLDRRRFGTADWNPLGELALPGQTVLIKPNWVRHFHLRGDDPFSLITHPSVLRPLVDYAYRAVGAGGRVWLMDAPLFDTDFGEIRRLCQLDALQEALRGRGVPLVVADLRSLVVRTKDGVVRERHEVRSWESEGVEFDLGLESELAELGPTLANVFGSDYDRRVTASLHALLPGGGQRHCYKVSRRVLEADLVISVPKLKTHKKTGVSLNVKNMIGINTDKNYIPHYRVGAPSSGGDEFPDSASPIRRARRWIVRHAVDTVLGRFQRHGENLAHLFMKALLAFRRGGVERKAGRQLDPIDVFYRTVQGDVERTGNWSGNDTCWRCGLDLNRILVYGTSDGVLVDRPIRRYLSVVDGVVGGDDDGPLAPRPRRVGALVAGSDPISVDTVAARVMGFESARVRDLVRGEAPSKHPITDPSRPIQVLGGGPDGAAVLASGGLEFRPHENWVDALGA